MSSSALRRNHAARSIANIGDDPVKSLIKAYLDTNVFLVFFQDEVSNCELVLDAANNGYYIPVISSHSLFEVMKNLKRRYSKDAASWMRAFILSLPNLQIIERHELDEIGDKYRDLCDDIDDLPHINAYIYCNCDYFVTLNRRLTQMRIQEHVNFITPKSFLATILRLEYIETENDR